MITGINESKTLTKHVSCERKCKHAGRKCNSNQWWNNDKCRCECKKHHIREKDYIWNPGTGSCKNGKYLASIIDNSVITCDEIINADVEATIIFIILRDFLMFYQIFLLPQVKRWRLLLINMIYTSCLTSYRMT